MSGARAAEPGCAAPPPADVAHLLSALALPRGVPVGYREEVSHPALARPEVSEGTMWIAADGTLVRDQTIPERQISEVGDSMLTTRAGPGAEPVLYPVPAELRPMLAAIRGVLAGDAAAIEAGFAASLSSDEPGWTLVLRPVADAPVAEVDFAGCGSVLRRMEIAGSDNVHRSVTFLPRR